MTTEVVQTPTDAAEADAPQPVASREFAGNHFADTGKMVAVLCPGRLPANPAEPYHFVGITKMVGRELSIIKRFVGANKTICLPHRRRINSVAIDPIAPASYRSSHISPLAVRPLDYPERVPTPWGFFIPAGGAS